MQNTNETPDPRDYLRAWRKKRGLNLRALGEKTGVSYSHLAALERHEQIISWQIAKKLKPILKRGLSFLCQE